MANTELPNIVPIFPLTGVMLLPGMLLPLNVFEPRYRNMVEDAEGEAPYIAMVQPLVPRQDNSPPPDTPPEKSPESPPENSEIYPVGCVGRMEECEQTPDGRYLITLKGISRYRSLRELPLYREYRRVEADYAEFAADSSESDTELDPARMLEVLQSYRIDAQPSFNVERLKGVPGIALLNGLAMSLPFAPAEKQALLEASPPAERERILLELMGMGQGGGLQGGGGRGGGLGPAPLN